MLRIFIADDHEVVRLGLRRLLEARSGWKVVGEAANGGDAVRKAVELKPDVAIIEYDLPMVNGANATRAIRAYEPSTEVLIFTRQESDQLLRDIFMAGARGFLLKSDVKRALHMAVESVARHELFLTACVLERSLCMYLSEREFDPDPLTAHERVVVQLVAEGKCNKAIARILSIGIKTVESHRAKVMGKLGISSIAELVRYAVRVKLAEP
jgi:DNA-binding NarL/FixJ family response regulator